MNECLINQRYIDPGVLILLGGLLGSATVLIIILVFTVSRRCLEEWARQRTIIQQRQEAQRREDEALARAQVEEEILNDIDRAFACSACWEENHPGLLWPEPWKYAICGTHYAKALFAKMDRAAEENKRQKNGATHPLPATSKMQPQPYALAS